jgi:hypothetical protein
MAMRILGAMYIVGAISFFCFPRLIFWILNLIPRVFRLIEPLPPSSEYFWLVLATSMMVMLAFIAFGSAASPQTRILAWTHLASKFTSTACYAYLFIFDHHHYFAYLAGVITDFPIFLIVAWFALRAFRALRRETPA